MIYSVQTQTSNNDYHQPYLQHRLRNLPYVKGWLSYVPRRTLEQHPLCGYEEIEEDPRRQTPSRKEDCGRYGSYHLKPPFQEYPEQGCFLQDTPRSDAEPRRSRPRFQIRN